MHSPEPVSHPEAQVAVPAVGGQAPAAPGHDIPGPVTSEHVQAVVHALVADPALMDALAKALVARLGDQVLREIAWEVMPDLAGRLQR